MNSSVLLDFSDGGVGEREKEREGRERYADDPDTQEEQEDRKFESSLCYLLQSSVSTIATTTKI